MKYDCPICKSESKTVEGWYILIRRTIMTQASNRVARAAYFASGWNRKWTIAENECRDVKRWERITKRAIRANLAFKVESNRATEFNQLAM